MKQEETKPYLLVLVLLLLLLTNKHLPNRLT